MELCRNTFPVFNSNIVTGSEGDRVVELVETGTSSEILHTWLRRG